ncbi:MAG: efflux RND transporter periplasmic adaptor subunit, partial [Rhodospirillales bacterium]
MIKAGQDVIVSLDEMPGQKFRARWARTSGAIDTATRTMQTEIALPNRDGKLLPGAYARVSLPTVMSKALIVPINTLLFRAEGPARGGGRQPVARVQMRPVTIGRDFGTSLEILNGITANDRLVLKSSGRTGRWQCGFGRAARWGARRGRKIVRFTRQRLLPPAGACRSVRTYDAARRLRGRPRLQKTGGRGTHRMEAGKRHGIRPDHGDAIPKGSWWSLFSERRARPPRWHSRWRATRPCCRQARTWSRRVRSRRWRWRACIRRSDWGRAPRASRIPPTGRSRRTARPTCPPCKMTSRWGLNVRYEADIVRPRAPHRGKRAGERRAQRRRFRKYPSGADRGSRVGLFPGKGTGHRNRGGAL